MDQRMLNTPVVLIIFRRPDLTARVVEALARVRPRTLLVVADGPRPGRPDDIDACQSARAVIDTVDWPCDIVRQYSSVNLGCGHRPASGITWALEQVDRAIILEDDCVPHPTFFRFCEEMLDRYADDERVMHVAGSNLARAPLDTPYSYLFSLHNIGWGWATWRRAWRYFDPTVRMWEELRQTSWLPGLVRDPRGVRHWTEQFDRAYERRGDVSYWDYQWTFACWANSGLSIVPRTNLVSNVGCGPDGTHTLWDADPAGNVPVAEMAFPLTHPPRVLAARAWDEALVTGLIIPRLSAPRPSLLRRFASKVAPAIVKDSYRQLASAARELRPRRSL